MNSKTSESNKSLNHFLQKYETDAKTHNNCLLHVWTAWVNHRIIKPNSKLTTHYKQPHFHKTSMTET
jgi:hypothetical protein